MLKERSAQVLQLVRDRAARLPWRRIGIGFAVVVALLVTVAPLRRAAALGTSRVILWLASPITPFVPDFDSLPDTTRVLAADGSELAALSGDNGRRQIVELDAIPEHVRRAVLAAEDADFYDHSGTNPLATAAGRGSAPRWAAPRAGAPSPSNWPSSTTPAASAASSARSARSSTPARSRSATARTSSSQRYLNQVYFGEGAYGIYSAAHSYFGVDPAQLTPAQAAMLAGKIQAPSRLDPRQKPDEVLNRREPGPAGHGTARLARPAPISTPRWPSR